MPIIDRRLARRLRAPFAILGCVALLAACAAAEPTLGKIGKTDLGDVLVDGDGHTLYVYDDDDVPGRSHCTPPCTVFWRPAEATVDAKPGGSFTIILRESGARQWAYKGKPLYTSFLDIRPGLTLGDGTDGEWHVARP